MNIFYIIGVVVVVIVVAGYLRRCISDELAFGKCSTVHVLSNTLQKQSNMATWQGRR